MCAFQGYYNVVLGHWSWSFCLELDFFKQLLALIWIFCMFFHIECIRRIFVFVTFSLFYKTLLNNGKDLSGNKNSKIKIRLSK